LECLVTSGKTAASNAEFSLWRGPGAQLPINAVTGQVKFDGSLLVG
jgi:hypothetical protein